MNTPVRLNPHVVGPVALPHHGRIAPRTMSVAARAGRLAAVPRTGLAAAWTLHAPGAPAAAGGRNFRHR